MSDLMKTVQALHDARVALQSKQPLSREERASCLRAMAGFEFQKAAADLESLAHDVRPSGVVAVILPSIMGFRYFAQIVASALAAGNAVVVKPSSKDPATAAQIKKMVAETKWPAGVLQVVEGTGAEVGELLASHPSVRAVYLMGKLETGQRVAELALPSMKKLHLGLGYNNSALVLKDLSESEAALLAKACFQDDGRNPYNITKIFVQEGKIEAFLEAWLPHAKKYQKPMGGLEATLATLQKSRSKILLGESGQAPTQTAGLAPTQTAGLAPTQTAGLAPTQTAGLAPIVALDLSHCSDLQQDCLRLPVVVVAGVKYPHEMIRWTNTAYYGHSAVVFAEPDKAEGIARKLEVGTVFVNTWISEQNPETPLVPGIKQSFYGDSDLSVDGSFLTERQRIVKKPSEQ